MFFSPSDSFDLSVDFSNEKALFTWKAKRFPSLSCIRCSHSLLSADADEILRTRMHSFFSSDANQTGFSSPSSPSFSFVSCLRSFRQTHVDEENESADCLVILSDKNFIFHSPTRTEMNNPSDALPLLADSNERFRTIRELGSGTYGRVVLAFDRDHQQRCALKILQRSSTKLRDFQRELNYSLLLTNHRSIINIFEERCFQTDEAFVIVQEYAPLGDLFESIPPQRGLPERAVKTIMKQVASALQFMHEKGLVS